MKTGKTRAGQATRTTATTRTTGTTGQPIVTAGLRRARVAIHHRLAGPGRDQLTVADVAGALLGLHATDAASVFLAVRARLPGAEPKTVESALYDERSVVRMLGMRRTMFVVPLDLMATIQVACTDAIAARERQRLVQLIEQVGIAARGDRWLAKVEPAVLMALGEKGEATASELGAAVPELTKQFTFGEGKKWAGQQSIGSRVLFVLAAEGAIVRGRPRGSWISTQYRWAPTEAWLNHCGGGAAAAFDRGAARADLVRRWLAAFGPATVDDIKWWTGWTMGETKKALTAVDVRDVVIEVGADGEQAPGIMLADDDVDAAGDVDLEAPEPWVAFLPALDPTVMGWKHRGWYLGGNGARLFDRSGNAGPTVWADGQVIGGWGQRPTGEVVFRLFDQPSRTLARRVEAEAERLMAWLGPVRVVARFRTPLERELTA